ncbi:CD58 antigen [Aix galericulata]|nr:CD58 antigen [Aix galericulata]
MKLVVLWGLEKLLLVGSFLTHIYCEEEVFGISGENFTFPVKADKKIEEVIWTKDKDKVAEWEGQNEPTYFNSLRSRSLLNKESGNLTIFKLENSDNGIYRLERFSSGKENGVFTFRLVVLDAPSTPRISCNLSDDNLMLTCEANFQGPLNYGWKITGRETSTGSEVSIPRENVDTGGKATCFVTYLEITKSSEIPLNQCFPTYQGYRFQKRSRPGLIIAFVVASVFAGAGLIYMFRKKANCGTGGADQIIAPDGEEEKSEANGGRPGNDNNQTPQIIDLWTKQCFDLMGENSTGEDHYRSSWRFSRSTEVICKEMFRRLLQLNLWKECLQETSLSIYPRLNDSRAASAPAFDLVLSGPTGPTGP